MGGGNMLIVFQRPLSGVLMVVAILALSAPLIAQLLRRARSSRNRQRTNA